MLLSIPKSTGSSYPDNCTSARSGSSQTTAPVLVLTGDTNLEKIHGDSIVQKQKGEPSVETQWQVLTSNAALSGDVLFIKGAFG